MVANLGLGGFIGFVIGLAAGGLAASTKQLVFTCTACKTSVDVTNWKEPRFSCPSVGNNMSDKTPDADLC